MKKFKIAFSFFLHILISYGIGGMWYDVIYPQWTADYATDFDLVEARLAVMGLTLWLFLSLVYMWVSYFTEDV